ncbi:MAG: hypothetical protein MK188_08730 [Gammaproteobacteria bacterium]|nr:hypothetical protein [Gammaproteobacteria bacterium]
MRALILTVKLVIILSLFNTTKANECGVAGIDVYKSINSHLTSPSFDWSTPSRYKIDNNEGTPLLPNTLEYVMNWESLDGSTEEACPCPPNDEACRQGPPKFKVHLQTRGGYPQEWTLKTEEELISELEGRGCPNPSFLAGAALRHFSAKQKTMTSFWTIRQSAEIADFERGKNSVRFEKTHSETGNALSICLPEGKHRVSLATSPREAKKLPNSKAPVTTRTIEVKDHLIVVLGDSFASGEGAPEGKFKSHQISSWAKALPTTSTTDLSTIIKIISDYPVSNPDSNKCNTDLLNLPSAQKRLINHIDNIRSHRSSFTHASQLALELENKSNKSSVTFINLAQSGATIDKGVMGDYLGYLGELPQFQRVTSYGRQTRTEVVITSGGHDAFPHTMCPQTELLPHLVGPRTPDEIYLSVGGNDVGFANAIAALSIAHTGVPVVGGDEGDYSPENGGVCKGTRGTICKMLRSVKSGDWDADYWHGLFGSVNINVIEGGAINTERVVGMDGLAQRYAALNQELKKLFQGVDKVPPRVTLIAPPFFGRTTIEPGDGETKLSAGEFMSNGARIPTYYCDLFTPNLINLDFDPIEFKIADHEIYRPLKSIVIDTERLNGWNAVTQNELDVARIGICNNEPNNITSIDRHHYPIDEPNSSYRGYNKPIDSKKQQIGDVTSTKGQYHPNKYGYKFTKSLLWDDIERQRKLKYSEIINNEADDSIPEVAHSSLPAAAPKVIDYYGHQAVMHRVDVPAFTFLTANFAKTSGYGDCPVVSIYEASGRLVNSSSPMLQYDSDLSTHITRSGALPQHWEEPIGRCGKGFALSNNQPDYVEYGGERATVSKYNQARVTIDNGCKAKSYYVAVSSDQNILFDPVTGQSEKNDLAPSDTGKLEIIFSPSLSSIHEQECSTNGSLNGQIKEERINIIKPKDLKRTPSIPQNYLDLIEKEN